MTRVLILAAIWLALTLATAVTCTYLAIGPTITFLAGMAVPNLATIAVCVWLEARS